MWLPEVVGEAPKRLDGVSCDDSGPKRENDDPDTGAVMSAMA